MTDGRHIVLIIGGSIAAYKALELIRLLTSRGDTVTGILTEGGAAFITALSVSSLTGRQTYSELLSLTQEQEMGHIALARSADMILVAPATAELMANMASGRASTLATAMLLASDPARTPVYVAPAMNAYMWAHPATRRNMAQLARDGITIIEPEQGDMACGESGYGRFAEPTHIVGLLQETRHPHPDLRGTRVIITAGATQEALDPVRYISNRSSGKQAAAIARSHRQRSRRSPLGSRSPRP